MADTLFAASPPDVAALTAAAERPAFGAPTTRWVGHYDGTPPQLEALALKDDARGREPAGMDTALLAYSGISVKMLVDGHMGASLLTMFTVDYEPGAAAQAHDHPFEETYFFTAGEVEAELDGIPYTLRAGDVIFAGVGSVHGFWNDGDGPGALDRDPGAPAAVASRLSMGEELAAACCQRHRTLAGPVLSGPSTRSRRLESRAGSPGRTHARPPQVDGGGHDGRIPVHSARRGAMDGPARGRDDCCSR